jgi:transcription initiation factor TFIID subunit 1
MPPPLIIPSAQKLEELSKAQEKKPEKKLDTPLGAMLPSKYQNVDVTEIFPDFRQDKVLRFSRLFGPGKFSSLPQIWRSVRRRAKKKKKEREMKMKDSDSPSDSDEPRRCNGFNMKYAPTPPKEACMSDDEEKLLREISNEEREEKLDKDAGNENKNKIADWRFGPAQIWYDMLDVPETGEGNSLIFFRNCKVF